MNMRGNATLVNLGWFLTFAGVMVVAAADGASTESTQPPAAEAFAQFCIEPYREELTGWQAAHLGGEKFRQAVLAARAAAGASCSLFVERIEKDTQLGADESRVVQDARDLLARTPRGECLEARAVAEIVRNAESLYRIALCTPSDDERAALLREAVEIDPGHRGALLLLADSALDSQVRSEYGASLYEHTDNFNERMWAVKAIIEGAIDTGDVAAVQEIRERVRRDLMSQPPLDRCTAHLDSLGLEEICLEAIEEIAADALSAGKVLPNEVVSQVDYLFWEIGLSINMPSYIRSEAEVAQLLAQPGTRAELAAAYADSPKILDILKNEAELARWMRGEPQMVNFVDRDARLADWLGWEPWGQRKAAQLGRLKAVLGSHPERLRTSEHHLALANTASTWRERIGSLRRAVEVDAGSVRARCELAGALASVGDLDRARRRYSELLAEDDGSCNAQERLDALNNRAPPEVVPLDESQEFLFYLFPRDAPNP